MTDPNYFSINSVWNSQNYWLAITDDWKTSDSLNLDKKEKWIKFVCDLDTGTENSPKRLLSNLVKKYYIFYLFVVYFDQHLGAVHPKTLVEIFIFSIFGAKKLKKCKKSNKSGVKFSKKKFFKFAPKHWSKVFFLFNSL